MDRFQNDLQIIYYIKNEMKNMDYFIEHRLYREEQMQGTKNIFRVRNSVEWIIRINKILKFIKHSVLLSIKFATKLESPMDENEIKDMYTYYLEDSVYRLMVLWDMYKQLVNEFDEVGFKRNENYTIFNLMGELRNKRIWNIDAVLRMDTYLNSPGHKFVREYLRNTFTHGVDPTSMNIFHDFDNNGMLSPDMDYMLPKHPYENLLRVVDDLQVLNDKIDKVNDSIKNILEVEIMLVYATAVLKCDDEIELGVHNIADLLESKEFIGVIVQMEKCNECEYMIICGGKNSCKPKQIRYSRIEEEKEFTLDISDNLPRIN